MAKDREGCSGAGVGLANALHHLPGLKHVVEGAALLSEFRAAKNGVEAPFRVAACGLYNAGKSYLLNALTDQGEDAAFPTGAARTTTVNKSVRHGGADYVDTPGLDANERDDTEAWRALGVADLLLFVHDPQTGELHEAEVSFLSKLSSLTAMNGSLSERLVVVLTHLDSWEDDMDNTASAVVQQVKDRLGFAPALFPVSSVAYRRGLNERKLKLVEYSGVPTLRDYLQARIDRHCAAMQVHRLVRVETIRSQLLNAVDREIATRGAMMSEIRKRSAAREQRRDEDFGAIFENIASRINQFRLRG